MRLFSNWSQFKSKCGENKKSCTRGNSVSLMFLPHFDVLCDLLLNRRTETWNLFVLYNKETNYYSFFILKYFSIVRKPAFAHLGKYKKKHLTWSVVYTKWSYLISCYAQQGIVTGPEKSRHCQTWLKCLLVEWKLTAKAELNCEICKC